MTIIFTHEFSKKSIILVDTTVKIDTTRELYTTLYEKPYRHTSVLTLHICTPQALSHQRPLWTRIHRICTKNEDSIHHGIKLIEYYLKRGYPFKALKKHMLKASAFTQDELLVIKNNETCDTPVMVTNYSPNNADIKRIHSSQLEYH